MGVKDLFKQASECGLNKETIHAKQYEGKVMAVDVCNLFHINMYHGHVKALENVTDPLEEPPENYKDEFEPTSYLINKRKRLSEAIKFIINGFIIPVLKAKIFPVFVFDGDTRPLKKIEVKKRVDQRSNSFANFFRERQEILEEQDIVAKTVRKNKLIGKLKYCYRVTREDLQEFKRVLEEIGFHPLVAKHDGEELCCSLVMSGKASLVYSKDSDCLMYGVPVMITSVHQINWGKMEGYTLASMLRCLGNKGDPLMIEGNMNVNFTLTKIERKSTGGSSPSFKIICSEMTFVQDGKVLKVRAPPTCEKHLLLLPSSFPNIVEIKLSDNKCPKLIVEGLVNGNTGSYAVSSLVRLQGSISSELLKANQPTTINIQTYVQIDGIVMGTDLPFSMFKDYCVMLGTDFNSRIRGIGKVKGLDLIKRHGSVKNIAAAKPNLDCTCLNYDEICEIFTPKNPTEYIKDGRMLFELIPSDSTKLTSKYYLSTERDVINRLIDRWEGCEAGMSDGMDVSDGDMLGFEANQTSAQHEIQPLDINQLMSRMTC